jgi:exopolyphosphatase/guanosine-5'-triphosphate,3'-diphosphate pyrophosphatase
MRELLEGLRSPIGRLRDLMERHVGRLIDQILHNMSGDTPPRMIALGGDANYAAGQLGGERPEDRNSLTLLPIEALESFTDRIMSLSVDDVVRTFHLTYPEADTLGPALLVYVKLARALSIPELLVSGVTMRDGLLMEIATRGLWTSAFREQIVQSARDLGRKFAWDRGHTTHVAELAGTLFKALKKEHGLGPRYEFLLHLAALLHEVGAYISNRNHQRHSMYVILNSELFGLGRKELLLVALIARYHRGSLPGPDQPEYAELDRDSQIAVSKLAAILRVADALERSHSQRVRDIRCSIRDGRLALEVPRLTDLSLEGLALSQKADLLEKVYGLRVHLERGGRG